jgi:hypothetical protein
MSELSGDQLVNLGLDDPKRFVVYTFQHRDRYENGWRIRFAGSKGEVDELILGQGEYPLKIYLEARPTDQPLEEPLSAGELAPEAGPEVQRPSGEPAATVEIVLEDLAGSAKLYAISVIVDPITPISDGSHRWGVQVGTDVAPRVRPIVSLVQWGRVPGKPNQVDVWRAAHAAKPAKYDISWTGTLARIH